MWHLQTAAEVQTTVQNPGQRSERKVIVAPTNYVHFPTHGQVRLDMQWPQPRVLVGPTV
jgi:hypothetical protein